MKTLAFVGLGSAGLWLAMSLSAAAVPAFPGAVGFGRAADGWRGGDIVRVTTLADAGPGSLRACASRPGSKICIFAISGTIHLDSPIQVSSDTYIAGQSAPGLGIELRLRKASSAPLIIDGAEDVLVRFLKLRPGPGAIPTPTVSGITVARSQNIYLDHLSIAFATDQNLSILAGPAPAHDITVAWSILAWGLDRANHPLGRHSKGALVCAQERGQGECGRITLYANLFSHNRDRNPEVRATALGPVEIVGNVIYNAKSDFIEIYNTIGDTRVNVVGNTILSGRSTRRTNRGAALRAEVVNSGAVLAIFAADNVAATRRHCGGPPLRLLVDGDASAALLGEPVAPLGVAAPDPAAMYERVLAGAGARRPGSAADPLDDRLIADLRECRGGIIDDPTELGSWPGLPVVAAPPDTDGDGMPDPWERLHGQDPEDASDAWRVAENQDQSNVERYLSMLAGDPVGAGLESRP